MGTTGTFMGVSRYLKEHSPRIRVVGVEPTHGHAIQVLKNMGEAIVPKIYIPSQLDEIVTVQDGEAFEVTRRLATEEGIFAGMSSGATMVGALQLADRMDSGVIVVLFPDRGDGYLSTMLFRGVCAKCPP